MNGDCLEAGGCLEGLAKALLDIDAIFRVVQGDRINYRPALLGLNFSKRKRLSGTSRKYFVQRQRY